MATLTISGRTADDIGGHNLQLLSTATGKVLAVAAGSAFHSIFRPTPGAEEKARASLLSSMKEMEHRLKPEQIGEVMGLLIPQGRNRIDERIAELADTPAVKIAQAVTSLRYARDLLKAAGAERAATAVRQAINSAEGAHRHALGKADRAAIAASAGRSE